MPVLSNGRWELFAQQVAKGKAATEAYADAGYKPHQPSASRLLSKAMVKARIAELQQKVAEKMAIDRAWVIDRLAINAERSMELREIEGTIIPGPLYNVTAANRALELIGKDLGLFRDRVEHTGKDGAAIEIETLSEETQSGYAIARAIAFALELGRRQGALEAPATIEGEGQAA